MSDNQTPSSLNPVSAVSSVVGSINISSNSSNSANIGNSPTGSNNSNTANNNANNINVNANVNSNNNNNNNCSKILKISSTGISNINNNVNNNNNNNSTTIVPSLATGSANNGNSATNQQQQQQLLLGISASSSRSSLYAPHSSTSLLSSADIDDLHIPSSMLHVPVIPGSLHSSSSSSAAAAAIAEAAQSRNPLIITSAGPNSKLTSDHLSHLTVTDLPRPGPNSGLNVAAAASASGRMCSFLFDSPPLSTTAASSSPAYNSNTIKMRKLNHQPNGGQQSRPQHTKLMMGNSDSGLSMSSVLPSSSSSSSLMASSNNYLSQQQQQLSMHLQSNLHHQIYPYLQSPLSATGGGGVGATSSSVITSDSAMWNSALHAKSNSLTGGGRNSFMPSSTSSLSSSSSLLHGNTPSSLGPDYDDYAIFNHINNMNNNSNGQNPISQNYSKNNCGANNLYDMFPQAMANRLSSSSIGGSVIYRPTSNSNKSGVYASSSSEPRSEYESLYKRYAELDSFHGEVVSKLSMAQAENDKQRKLYEQISHQFNQTEKEKASLQQQCTAAIRQWNKAIRENQGLQEQLGRVKQQRDEANKECNNAMAGRNKAIREKQRMYEERNTALQEYNLIMSERDSVHKEIEKFQEDLNIMNKRNETLEKDYKVTQEELESLRRELTSALFDRDRALKMCNDLREKYGEGSSNLYGMVSSSSGQPHNHSGMYSIQHQQQQQAFATGYDGQLYGHQQQSLYGQHSESGVHNAAANCSSSSNSSLLGVHHLAQSPTHLLFNGTTSGSGWAATKNSQHQQQQHISTASSTSSVSTFGMSGTHLAHSTIAGKIGMTEIATSQTASPSSHSDSFAATHHTNSGGSLNPSLLSNNNSAAAAATNNTEMDNLRKQIERLQQELQEAYQEIEVCKKRRDWAFSERDKIVLERESIRTLCDKLRRERDRKVSDLAEALRESDEIKRQKNEAYKELKEFKEKFDSGKLTNNNNQQQQSSTHSETTTGTATATTGINPKLIGKSSFNSAVAGSDNTRNAGNNNTTTASTTCTSQDSAIDVDMAGCVISSHSIADSGNNPNNNSFYTAFDTEIVDLSLARQSIQIDWGFKLNLNTKDSVSPPQGISLPVLVTYVDLDSSASRGKLQLNDQLVKVNDILLASGEENSQLTKSLKSLIKESLHLNLKVRRRLQLCSLKTVSLPLLLTSGNNDNGAKNNNNHEESLQRTFGFDSECVVQVTRIDSNSSLYKDGRLSVGDRIVSVDGIPVDSVLRTKLFQFMLQSSNPQSNSLTVQVAKSASPILNYHHFHKCTNNSDNQTTTTKGATSVSVITGCTNPANCPPKVSGNGDIDTSKTDNNNNLKKIQNCSPAIEPGSIYGKVQSKKNVDDNLCDQMKNKLNLTGNLAPPIKSEPTRIGDETFYRHCQPPPPPLVTNETSYQVNLGRNRNEIEVGTSGSSVPGSFGNEHHKLFVVHAGSKINNDCISSSTTTTATTTATSNTTSSTNDKSLQNSTKNDKSSIDFNHQQKTFSSVAHSVIPSVELTDEDEDEDDRRRPVYGEDDVDEAANDADEDEPNESYTTDTDDAEIKTLAELDKVLDKYQIEDYYGSTVTNSSGCSLVPQPQQPQPLSLPLPQQPSIVNLQQTQLPPLPQSQSTLDSYETIKLPNQIKLNETSTVSGQPQPQPLSQQQLLTSATIVRRSNRLSKKNRHRCTLAASQLSEAAHELTLALAASSNNTGAGDTWPRYRPHQLLSSVLPSFYKHHAQELRQIYSKQGQRAPLPNFDDVNYITTIHHHRRKQRKSLGVFLDIFPTATMMTSGTTPAPAVASSSSTTIDTATTSSTPSARRSPRIGHHHQHTHLHQLQQQQQQQQQHHVNPHQDDRHFHDTLPSINHYSQAQRLVLQSQLNNSANINSGNNSSIGSMSAVLNQSGYGSHRTDDSFDQMAYLHHAAAVAAHSHSQTPQTLHPDPHHAHSSQLHQQHQTHLQPGPIGMRMEQTAPPPPPPPSQSHHYATTLPHSQYGQHHLESDLKMATLSRNSVFNKSIKTNNSPNTTENYYSFEQPDGAVNSDYFYSSQQQQQQQSHSSYSPIYSTYSYLDKKKLTSGGNESSKQQQSQQSSGTEPPPPPAPPQQSDLFLYPNHMMPSTTSVDYSVVSAQSKDKDVLKYYKTRQVSGSSQTGSITGGGTGPNSMLPLLTPFDQENANQNKVARLQQQQQQQQQSMKSYTQSDQQAAPSIIPADIYSVSFNNDIYGQTRPKPITGNEIYGSISGRSSSSIINNNNNNNNNNARNSVPVSLSFSCGPSNYPYNPLVPQIALPGSTSVAVHPLSTAVAGLSHYLPNHHAAGISGEHQPSIYETLVPYNSGGGGGIGQVVNQPLIPSSSASLINANNADKVGSNVGIGGNNGNQSNGSIPSNHRLSMNLANMSLNITSASLVPTRDSLLMASGLHHSANNNNNNNNNSVSSNNNNSWINEIPPYSATSANSSSSSRTLPKMNSHTQMISIPSAASHSFKDNSNFSSNHASIYDSSHLSSRTSITSSTASHHQYPLSENIYGLSKGSLQHSNRATPPPPAPPSQSYSSSDEAHMVSNFDDNLCQALNLMPTRSQRFRIPSNSSSVSASKASSKSTFSGLILDKPLATTAYVSGPGAIAIGGNGNGGCIGGGGIGPGPTGNICIGNVGDRNSCSLMQAGGAPYEVKWIKCTKDGSPGSPILDPRKAKIDDYRLISIERSSALLGIRILRNSKSKGVFVQMVTEGSLAAQTGIKVGDQIIDICGINMRTADYENAAKVLNQCGDPIQMLIQFNSEKFKEILMMRDTDRYNSVDSVGLGSTDESCIKRHSCESNDLMIDDVSAIEANGVSHPISDSVLDVDSHQDELAHSVMVDGSDNRFAAMFDQVQTIDIDDPTNRRQRRRRHDHDVTPASSSTVTTRHNTLTNEDVSSSATSTLTRRPKVASLPHECSLLSNSPSSITSSTPSQAILPFSASSFVVTDPKVSHGSSLYSSSHFRNNANLNPAGGNASGKEDSENSSAPSEECRRIVIKKTSSSLGLSLIGGNAVGIFIHSIRDETLSSSGLTPGDQIVEYNGVDLRHATAEEAAIELAKPAEVVEVLVQHNMQRFLEIKQSNIGDSFYIKCSFDRPSIDGSLPFHKDDILYVDNTMYNGVPGLWRAWHVDAEGNKIKCGVIPSRYKAEEEMMMKRGGVYCDSSSAISSVSLSGSTRRSFFRRRKTGSSSGGSGSNNGNSGSGGGGPLSTIAGIAHFRSSSRDSTTKEIACYSDIASLKSGNGNNGGGIDGIADNNNGTGNGGVGGSNESGQETTSPEYLLPLTYMHVEKLSYELPRPVIIIGPLKEIFIEKLEQDFPRFFQRCLPELILRQHNEDSSSAAINQQLLDNWLQEKKLVDYRRRGSYLECTTISSVKKIAIENNLHALLDVSPQSVERLNQCNIYPVVVSLKFKSTRQIKEINRCPSEKLSSKAAKEMYEHSLKVETEFKELITVTIPGSNLSYMCTQVKTCVDEEQNKALWL